MVGMEDLGSGVGRSASWLNVFQMLLVLRVLKLWRNL